MAPLRSRYEGVANIVRFNWPFFATALAISLSFAIAGCFLNAPWSWLSWLISLGAVLPMAASLFISHLAYDRSELYAMPWLSQNETPESIVTINAGFDEISPVLEERFPDAEITRWDFFDADRHTEPSIARARKRYPLSPETLAIEASRLSSEPETYDLVILFMSAHEIRSRDEQLSFFNEVHQILRPDGEVVVTEHLRDLPNFLAYTIGFLHFHSLENWLSVFEAADFEISQKHCTSRLIHTFHLRKKC